MTATQLLAIGISTIVGAAVARQALAGAWAFIRGAAKVPFVLEAITKEFNPSSDTSMRSSLDRIEERIDVMERRGVAGYREVSDRMQLAETRITDLEIRLDGPVAFPSRSAVG